MVAVGPVVQVRLIGQGHNVDTYWKVTIPINLQATTGFSSPKVIFGVALMTCLQGK